MARNFTPVLITKRAFLLVILYSLFFNSSTHSQIIVYGMTQAGGTKGNGNIFSYNVDSNQYKNCVSFTGTSGKYIGKGANYSYNNLTEGFDGNIYGMTNTGGTKGKGNIFKYDPINDSFTNLVSFTGTSGRYVGENPFGSLLQASDGYLYGMTQAGGTGGYGNMFKYDPVLDSFSNIISFTGISTPYLGWGPDGNLIEGIDGCLYGMTIEGGPPAYHNGNIFKYDPKTNGFTDLLDFEGIYTTTNNGNLPYASLVQAYDSNFYGMTTNGGIGIGNIFGFITQTNADTQLVEFSGGSGATVGELPYGSLVQASDSSLYGMTSVGGAHGEGNIFKFNPKSATYTNLVDFTGASGSFKGGGPTGSLIEAKDSNLYGMTVSNIFQYNFKTNTYTVLVTFSGTSGAYNGKWAWGSLMEYRNSVIALLNISACNNYIFKGDTLAATGVYYDTLTAARGCDSIVILHLTINNSTIDTANIIACDSYDFNGNTLTTNGTYTDTLTSVAGCDSVVTLYLTLYNSSSSTINITSCDNYTFGSQMLTASGTYTNTLVNATGCDSIITLNLTINNSDSSTISNTACDQYFFNGNTLTTSGTYHDTLMNATGCDSIITLKLTIHNSVSTTQQATACNHYMFNGKTLSSSGTYYDSLSTIHGCDSIVILNLTIHNTVTNNLTISSCYSYAFNGKTLTSSGTYYDSLTASNTCDSIIILDLTIHHATSSTVNSAICSGNTYNFNGKNISTAGIYIDTLNNYFTCDSVITLNLTVNQNSASNVNATISQGNSYAFGGKNITAAGTYYDTLQNAVTCDSVVTLILAVTSGIEHVSSENYFTIFPNPNSGIFTIQFNNPVSEKQNLTIYNPIGEYIYSTSTVNPAQTIDLSAAAKGIYFVRYGNVVKKIILE